MNIKEISKFYNKNATNINKSLDIKENKDKIVYIYDKDKLESVSHINKSKSIDILYGKKFDIDLYKAAYLNSKYFMDDANTTLDKNKLIASTIPDVFKFVFKESKDSYVIDKISEGIEGYCTKIEDLHSRKIDTNFISFVKDTINTLRSNKKFDSDGKILSCDKRYNIPQIKNGYEIIFINKQDILVYSKDYSTYVRSKMLTKDGVYTPTIGANSNKNFRHLNKHGIYESFYFNSKSGDQNMLADFGTFLNILRFIPNKFIILDDNYQNIFNLAKNYKNIGEILDIISLRSESKDVKLLESNHKGEIIFFDNINVSNLNICYRTYKGGKYEVNEINRYELYNIIISLFQNQYIDLYNENKDKKYKSSYSGVDILLDSLYETIKDGLHKFIYYNDKSQLITIYNKIVNFIMDKKLSYKKENGKVVLDKYKLLSLNDLKYNLTSNDNNNMDKIKEKEMAFWGYRKYNNQAEAEKVLNDMGIELLEKKDKKFVNNLERLFVKDTYTNNNEEINNEIENNEEFSFFIGKLLSILQKYSVANDVSSMILKFYGKTSKEAAEVLLDIEERYLHLIKGDSKKVYDKMKEKVISYAMKNQKERINKLSINLGNLNNY